MRKVYEGIVVIVVFLIVAVGLPPAQPEASLAQARPNIVFILTDDQDTNSLRYMPTLQSELVQKGTTFENHVLTLPSCCPSRVTFLRGEYAHNHRVTASSTNAASDVKERGLDESTVATWLDSAGYKTALVGKYLNDFRSTSYVPPGWDSFHANASRDVWAECLNENGRERCYTRHPDAVLAEKAEEFVRQKRAEPFFLYLAMSAPHDYGSGAPLYPETDSPPKFSDAELPKSPSFGEKDLSDKPPWVADSPPMTEDRERALKARYRERLRSLQTLDRTISRLVDALSDVGKLDNTYIFYTTDNGYHMGEHRLEMGKYMPYREDVNFPLIVRGPGVAKNVSQDAFVLNTDFAPTVAELGGAQTDTFVDGRSITPLLRGESPEWRAAALIEGFASPKLGRPAYSGIWTAQGGWYVDYSTGERELYDLSLDPYQLQNIYVEHPEIEQELAGRLERLRDCAGATCRTAEDGP